MDKNSNTGRVRKSNLVPVLLKETCSDTVLWMITGAVDVVIVPVQVEACSNFLKYWS